MKYPRFYRVLLLALVPWLAVPACAAAAAAAAAAASAAKCPVSVRYADPQHFTEARLAANAGAHESTQYLAELKHFLLKRAPRILHHGQCLHIVVTDIDLAGEYEPWLGPQLQDVRIIRDVYPPRIALRFRLVARDGTLERKGSRNLRGLGVMSAVPPGGQESLPYAKALLSRWLGRGAGKL